MPNYTEIAQKYIENNYNVLPLKLDGSKQPIGEWKPYQERFASDHELQEWFDAEQCGIGVIAGAISSNLHVVDFDIDVDRIFNQFWTDAQQSLPGIADKLIVVATPRPGRQVWFRQESIPPSSQVLAYSSPAPGKEPQAMIETRGEGAYAVAVGTALATHAKATPYQLLHGSFENLPALTDAEAETLLQLCRLHTQWKPQNVQDSEPYTGEPRPGDIYNQHADLRQLLLDAGWTHDHYDAAGAEYLKRPGKSGAGHSASLGYIHSDDGKPLLYVFSSNAAPFEQHGCYDAFAAFTLLHHRGEFGTAAAAAKIQYAAAVNAAQATFHAQIAEQLPESEPYQPFPTNLFPDVVQPYVIENAGAIGIDPAYVAVPMLSVLAGLIGPSRGLELKRKYKQPSIIWTVTIGLVSSGKSPGWEAAKEPAGQIEAALHRAMAQKDAEYRKQLEAYEQKSDQAVKKPFLEKHTDQLMIDDATMETLIEIHKSNPKLILACDELAAWLRGMNQYRKGRDVENWLSIYNGGSMQVNRKTDGFRVYLKQTSISVCGTIQPGVAADTLYTSEFMENGFAARVMSVQPPGSIVRWSDAEVPEPIDDAMHGLAQQLYMLPQEQCGDWQQTLWLPCSGPAKQAFIQWTNDTADHAQPMEPALRASWLKLRPMAGRFALVFSVIKQLLHHPDGQAMQPVDAEAMQAGIDLAWWFGQELERNYSGGGGELKELQQHLDWILSKHPDGVDARQLQMGRRSIKTADDARAVMQKLMNTGCGTLDGLRFIPAP